MRIAKIIFVLVFTAIVSGVLLSLIYQVALPRIEANRKAEIEEAIYTVVPEAQSYERQKIGNVEYFQTYGGENNKTGIAFVAAGTGYQGEITIMVGTSQDLSTMKGIEILEQVETPGLGAEITEEDFTEQFRELNLEESIELVKNQAPEEDNEIAAITGATISSRSVVQIINNRLSEIRKVIQ